jgi:hypothetical protein
MFNKWGSLGHKTKCEVSIMLNVAHFFQLSIMLSEKFSSTLRQLSHLWMSLKFYCSRTQALAFARIHEVIPTSSLFQNQQPPKRCFHNPNKWSVTKHDPSAWQCNTKQNTSDTRATTITLLGNSVPSTLGTGSYFTVLHIHIACAHT